MSLFFAIAPLLRDELLLVRAQQMALTRLRLHLNIDRH